LHPKKPRQPGRFAFLRLVLDPTPPLSGEFSPFEVVPPTWRLINRKTKLMKSLNRYEGLNTLLVTQVKYHARSLIRHPAINGMEIEDLEQEIMLDAIARIKDFDPSKAQWSTFIDRILNHKCASLIQTARSQKRGHGETIVSLDAWLADNDGEDDELQDTDSPDQAAHDLRIDLERAVETMPPRLVFLLIDLRTFNLTEISRLRGTPRATLYGVMHELRAALSVRHITDYLPNPVSPTFFEASR
jgi:RNA polymerase sigma-70 factor (ECF subfamily)